MTIEEMKLELEKNGYLVKKLRDYSQKKLEERSKRLRQVMRDYVYNYTHIYNDNFYNDVVEYLRTKRIKFYGYKVYKSIPDEKWPEIEKLLIEDGKKYVDIMVEKDRQKRPWLWNYRKNFNAYIGAEER